jgi:predicted restriction endonuclease
VDIALVAAPIDKLNAEGLKKLRKKRLAEIATRAAQPEFGKKIRANYGGRCAVTGCKTRIALEAAHIRVHEGADDNSASNGILLRRDIHALFDEWLITFTADGKRLQVSPNLDDYKYAYL